MARHTGSIRSVTALLVIASLLVAACAPSSAPTSGGPAAQPTAAPAKPAAPAAQAPAATAAPAQQAKPAAPAASGPRTKVRAMGTTVDPQKGLQLWEKWKANIEKLYPDIEVEFITPVPGINTEKLLTMVASGDAPDVLQTTSIEYAARGLLVDLTPFIERDKILEQRPYFKKSVEAAKYSNKFYAVPGGLSTYVFWVNLDDLEKAGFKYPENGVLTFDQFEQIAQKVTAHSTDPGQQEWGYVTSPWFSRVPPLVWARGGDLFDYDEKTGFAVKSTFNSKPVIDAIQWNADLINRLKVSPPNEGEAEKAGFSFYTGKVTFQYGGNWILADGREKIKDRFKWAPLRVPVMKAGDQPLEMVPAFVRGSILASAKDREAAWKVLKYVSSPEANVLYSEFVTDEIIFDTPEFRKRFTSATEPQNAELMLRAAEDAGKRPLSKSEVRVLYGWARMVSTMANELAPVYEGKAKVADVAPAIEKELNAVIQEGKSQGFDPANPPDALKKP